MPASLVRPGERNADDGDRPEDRDDEMAERQPPAGEDEPDQIAGKAEQSGADIVAAGSSARDTAFRPNGNSV